MKPSELAIKLEKLRSRFEEEWDPEDVKSIAEFIIEYGGSFAVALRHHASLVEALEGIVHDTIDVDPLPFCLQKARAVLTKIERERGAL